jgi:hypothetical protein
MSSASKSRRPPAACTIVSRNYLSYARVLAKSYAQHEPGSRFYLLIVDGLPEGAEVGADVCLLGPEDLDIPYFYEMCFEYDVAELCTAVKPSLLLLLFNRFQEEEVIFLDPDILVMRPLLELREPLAKASIVLTPNLLKPLPKDGRRPCDQDILLAGTFNLGFIALRKTDEAQRFLHWWEDRLHDGGALVHVPAGLMTDQKWCDLMPTLFPDHVIFRDETYNTAWWNINQRTITKQGDQFLSNGRPLTFYHFSGFDPGRPRVFTKEEENRTKLVDGTPLADLFDLYVGLHMQNGYQEVRTWRCQYSQFSNGVGVNLLLRRAYLGLNEEEQARFGNPFQVNGPDSFYEWAITPDPANGYLSPFILSLYEVRYDLQTAFPDLYGKDREALLEWAREDGARDLKYDPELMRVNEALALIRGSHGSAAAGAGDDIRPPEGSAAANGPRGWSPPAIPPKHIRRYQQLTRKIRELVRAAVPPEATLLVVSKGDEVLLKHGGRRAWHFPQQEDGAYAGYNPADSAEAVAHLEALRDKGAGYLLFPATALWWLEHYEEFKQHLDRHYRPVVELEGTCSIYALSKEPHQAGKNRRERVAPQS